MGHDDDFLNPFGACQFGQEIPEIAFVPIHVGFVNRVAQQIALRRPAIMDDRPVKVTQRPNLHRVAGRCRRGFAITMDIKQNPALAQICRIAQASPPRIFGLKRKWHDHNCIALQRLNFLRWRKTGVTDLFGAMVGQLNGVAATIGQAAGDDKIVLAHHGSVVVLYRVTARVFRKRAVRDVAIFDRNGTTRQ